MTRTLLVVAVIATSTNVRAEDPQAEGPCRWSLGLQLGPVDVPRGHLGIPLAKGMDAYHLPGGLIARWQWSDRMALTAGAGLAQGGLGGTMWVGHETFVAVAHLQHGSTTIELYEDAALTLGFAGPDYFARHDGVFVGYGYAFGGATAIGLRLPIGVRVRWLGAFDTFVEPAPLLMFTPSVEPLFELSVGFHVRL